MEIIRLILIYLLDLLLPSYGLPNEKLMLSPLICKGHIKQAQELSLVEDKNSIIPTSHAGFITVDEKLGNHLFFWLFPSISGSESPLVVWLNGGPGSPSSLGLFYENGPMRLTDAWYERSNISWTETMSMLYIDNPVSVGYSYSDSGSAGYRTDQDGYSKDLYEFIEQFYLLFPEYQKRELYIGGKSYGGKYVPAFAYYLHLKIKEGRSNLPLAGIYLEGPLFDPYEQGLAVPDYLLAVGAISTKEAQQHKQSILELFKELKRGKLNYSFDDLFDRFFIMKISFFLNNYYSGVNPRYDELQAVMDSKYLKSLVHVGNREFVFLSNMNTNFRNRMVQDFLTSTKPKLAQLLEEYKVLIYTGDQDALISPAMVDAGLLSMEWSRQQEYQDSKRSVWWGGDGALSGFYSRVGNLCQVVIKGGGHSAGHDQSARVYQMMNLFIRQGCIRKR
ncbi:probable serine carboxypeptidase CPVL [Physella acuta]|uniref:probable serine carboxypeptidase CPVL n=1 Tax=Physella acuta TaxID=109671 RepID=UPI0027DB81C6|nr:probable serine carboxypeptidase CPVL [Physella acuta]